MKNRLLSVLFIWTVFFLPGSVHGQSSSYGVWSSQKIGGQDSVDASGIFRTYTVPKSYPYKEVSSPFNVSVNQSYVGIYSDRNFWGKCVSFASFEFKDGEEIQIEIAFRNTITSFEILPKNAMLMESKLSSPKSISLKLNKADQQLTLVIDGEYQGHVLHLFCNSIDHNAPTVANNDGYTYDRQQKLHYFGAGFHKLSDRFSNGTLSISGDKKIYIAGGAVIEGQLRINNGQGAKIYGRGLLMNAEPKIVASIDYTTGSAEVEGIIIHGHRAQSWCTTMSNSSNIKFSNVKIITTRYASTDGIDVINCSDCEFDNVFVRSCDDAIAIKGLAAENQAPIDCLPNKNLIFRNMKLWNDCNNAFGMGAETRASTYENIQLIDSEILYSYDDPNHHTKLDERSALNICALQGTYFKNILFENIHVNRCERLIGMGFKSDFWFGSIQGDQSYPGEISGVTFRNIVSENNSGSSIANEIWLYGWHKDGTPEKKITHVTFDNVRIEGQPLENENNIHFRTNNTPDLKLVVNCKFNNATYLRDGEQGVITVFPMLVRQGCPIFIKSENHYPAWNLYSLQGTLIRHGIGEQVKTDNLLSAFYILHITLNDTVSKICKILIH